jgi:hypothetical protein
MTDDLRNKLGRFRLRNWKFRRLLLQAKSLGYDVHDLEQQVNTDKHRFASSLTTGERVAIKDCLEALASHRSLGGLWQAASVSDAPTIDVSVLDRYQFLAYVLEACELSVAT